MANADALVYFPPPSAADRPETNTTRASSPSTHGAFQKHWLQLSKCPGVSFASVPSFARLDSLITLFLATTCVSD